MGVVYYGSKLSPHIIKTPSGFLICKDAAICRTGTQQYLAKEIGISERGNDIITVYRLEEEVFKPSAMYSMEGVPLTLEHPNEFVAPDNAKNLVKGTITNIHKGEGSNSDLLLADIIVYDEQAINEIETKNRRELSVGYECEYVPYKDGYKQINILGNHVALVSAGRAGERVAIKDTAKNSINVERSKKGMGYKIPRKSNVTDFVKAVGLKTLAADAEPEEVAEMVEGLVDEKKQAEVDNEPVVIEPDFEDVAKDEDLEELKTDLEMVKDCILTMLAQDEDAVEEKEDAVADDDESCSSLDELEEELSEDEDLLEQVKNVEKPVEEIDEEQEKEVSDEEEAITKDSILELSKTLKPIIASIPDPERRKSVADSLANVLRKYAKKTEDFKSTKYSQMINRTKDSSQATEVDYGMEIAKKFNPHYKEEK